MGASEWFLKPPEGDPANSHNHGHAHTAWCPLRHDAQILKEHSVHYHFGSDADA